MYELLESLGVYVLTPTATFYSSLDLPKSALNHSFVPPLEERDIYFYSVHSSSDKEFSVAMRDNVDNGAYNSRCEGQGPSLLC